MWAKMVGMVCLCVVMPNVGMAQDESWRLREGDAQAPPPRGSVAQPFVGGAVDTSVGGLHGSSAASMHQLSQTLDAVKAQRDGPLPAPAQGVASSASQPHPKARVVERPAAAPHAPLEGGMEGGLQRMIVGKLGEDACASVDAFVMVGVGEAFRARCTHGGVFEVRPAGRTTSVQACASQDLNAPSC